MQNTNVYLALIDGAIAIRLEEPSEPSVLLKRLTAEEGMILTNGSEERQSVDVNVSEVGLWSEAANDIISDAEALAIITGESNE